MEQAVVQETSLVANLGEIKVSNDPHTSLSCLGVGSCIALCMYDPQTNVAGMAHIVLPQSNETAKTRATPTKYADIAIPELINRMREMGAVRSRLVTKIAGGSQMFSVGKSETSFDTGNRNVESVKKIMAEEMLKISGENTGGTKGRTVRMSVATGIVSVKSVGGPAVDL